MSKWSGGRTEIYHNKKIKQLIDEKKNHLKEHYEGPTDFFQQKLEEEETLSLEEKIEVLDEEIEDMRQEKEKLERIKEERKEQKTLKDKKERLQEKQEKLEEKSEEDFVDREEAEEQVLENLKDRAGAWQDMNDEEIKDTPAFDKKVERLVFDEDEFEDLRQEVEQLQEEVADLQGERPDWFLNLEQIEVTA
ncbi:MAG: hypothetical protein ABEK16_01075 [Candidatus Nanohalobium sp.]